MLTSSDDKLSVRWSLWKGNSYDRRADRQAVEGSGGLLYRGRGGGSGPHLGGGGSRAPDQGPLRAAVAGRGHANNTDQPARDAGALLRARARDSLRQDTGGHACHCRGRRRPDHDPLTEQHAGARERGPIEAAGAPDTEQTPERDGFEEGPLGGDALPDGGAGAGGPHGPLRLRGVRVRGHGTERGRPRTLLEREVRRAGTAYREA